MLLEPSKGDGLLEVAVAILKEPTADVKARWTHIAAELWREGHLVAPVESESTTQACTSLRPPDKPARDAQVIIAQPGQMPKRGRGGTLLSRQRMLHSLVHTESWAVDLAWDIIARFGDTPGLPREFFDDFVAVAEDEARHFRVLQARLVELGSSYGSMPAHDGLWESAAATAHSLAARIAVESCVHEARGLDVLPQTIARFRAGGDEGTAALLEGTVYPEEVSHCAAGVRWLTWLHEQAHDKGGKMDNSNVPAVDCSLRADTRAAESTVEEVQYNSPSQNIPVSANIGSSDHADTFAGNSGQPIKEKQSTVTEESDEVHVAQNSDWIGDARRFPTVESWFHDLVRKHFHGGLKAPFNETARHEAGLMPSWYLPLAKLPEVGKAA